ncbi:hypothetical protein DVH24_034119 [Malus domestica]|uniref:Uncharacterized protein n=1 Tax=Malus domestica TaxID=3750 RepID=A0A498KVL7_MALDO|nr:hypothetical protein DVH24_034119 [Malus domestica]
MSSQLLRLNAFRGEPASSGSSGISPLTTTHPLILQHQSSPAHSSTGTRSEPWAPPTAWELTVSCSISLPDGGSFTLPSRYYFTIGHPGVFSLARWSLLIHTGFHVSHATRVRAQASDAFGYWTLAI